MDDNECMRREDGDGGALEDAVAAEWFDWLLSTDG